MKTQELEAKIKALEEELSSLRPRAASTIPDPRGSARERLSSVAERASKTGSWAWNLATNSIEWSDEFYRILGLDKLEVSPSSEAFFLAIHDEDRKRVQATAASSMEMGAPATIDFRILRPSGEIRNVSMQAALVYGENGEREYLVGTVRDITEDLRTRHLLASTIAQLNQAQRTAGLGSFEIDLTREHLEWSEGLYRLLGVNQDEQLTRDSFWSRIHPDDLPRMREFQVRSRGTTDPPPIELRIVRPDGIIRDVRLVQVSVRDERGTVVSLHGVIQDISEHRALEAQLLQSQKMEAVGRLAGGIAHDFNNYLTVLSGHAELLKELVVDNTDAVESVEAIEDVTTRCAHLTQQLLTFSRRHRVRVQDVDLGALVEGLVPALRSALGETIELSVDFDSPPAIVSADPSQLEQVVLNLCFNARDAMPDGGKLQLSIDRVVLPAPSSADTGSKPLAMVQLTVRDTGNGIAPELLPRVFEPFFTTKEVGKGTGLGLAATYGIIQNSKGTIDVESHPGAGTVFRVRLPQGTNAVTESRPLEPSSYSHPSRSVLVVEDVPEVRELLCQQLSRSGYSVRSAENGQHALELLQTSPSDVVISDIVMPRLGGLELARHVEASFPETRCLLITGYSADILGQEPPTAEILFKPFSIKQLVTAIESAARSLQAGQFASG